MTRFQPLIDISVVIAVHNVEDYLEQCLYSLHCQSLKSAEFIVINDGSTDHCAEICDRYARLDSRFIVVHQECHGTLVARKNAFEMARAKWCICVDGDDFLPSDRVLEIEVELANKSDVDILRFDMEAFSDDENAVNDYLNFRKEWLGTIDSSLEITRAIFADGIIGWGMADKIYRTSVVKKAIKYLEDIFLICGTDAYQLFLICFYSHKFKSVKTEPLYSYRLGAGISSGNACIEKFPAQAEVLKIPNFLKTFLTMHKKSEEYSPILRAFAARLINHTIFRFDNLPINNCGDAFDYLFSNSEVKWEVLDKLQEFYSRDPVRLARKAYGSFVLNSCKRRVRKIGIFYPRLHNGGVERVISMQIPLFVESGFEVVLLVEEVTEKDFYFSPLVPVIILPREEGPKRIGEWQKALVNYDIDLVIYHASTSPKMLFDLLTVKLCKRYFVNCQHEITTQFLTWNSTFFTQLVPVYKLSDYLVVLNSMERFYYSSYGVHVLYIPNPLPPPHEHTSPAACALTAETFISRSRITSSGTLNISLKDFCCERHYQSISHRGFSQQEAQCFRHVVWIARLENNQKNYKEALEVFQKICIAKHDVICHIVGKGEKDSDAEYVRNFITSHKLQNRIIYEGFTSNPEQFLEVADVQLITSTYECFPMSLVEAKVYGVPTVLYDMPYLELLKIKKGYVSIPRHDVTKAARVICELLEDDARRSQLAREAKMSISEFMESTPSHIEGWINLIDSLGEKNFRQSLPLNQDFIDFVDSTISYCQEGINRHKEEILKYQNLSKQYQEENSRLQAQIKSHQEEVKNSSKKIQHLQKQKHSIQDELICSQEYIQQLNLLRKSEYDARMIERYAVCRDFVTKLCPLGTNRYVLIKKIAQVIYGLIKRGCQRENTRSSCDIGSSRGGVNHQ